MTDDGLRSIIKDLRLDLTSGPFPPYSAFNPGEFRWI